MLLACLDLEGVLVPEVWVALSQHTRLAELARTTRDEPDYDKLMKGRLAILDKHGITLPVIQKVIGELEPLPGAREFLHWLRGECQVIILSDTFYEFALPLMEMLGRPTLFCHRLVSDQQGRILGYVLRMPDQKRAAVEAFQKLNFKIAAAGDSLNDLSMLKAADYGVFFNPPDAVAKQNPQFKVTRNYAELRDAFNKILKENNG